MFKPELVPVPECANKPHAGDVREVDNLNPDTDKRNSEVTQLRNVCDQIADGRKVHSRSEGGIIIRAFITRTDEARELLNSSVPRKRNGSDKREVVAALDW